MLDPFLFLIYERDIADGKLDNIRLFADDTISLFAIIVDNDIFAPSMSLIEDLEKMKIIWSLCLAVDSNS